MRKMKLEFIILASIFCTVLTCSVSGNGVTRPDDSFPVPGVLYKAVNSTSYDSFVIQSMSLAASSNPGYTISPMRLGGGTFTIDSFFDVFVEVTLPDGSTGEGTLTGLVELKIIVPSDSGDGTGTFDTEIVSMSLNGEVGGNPIVIRDAASGLPTGKRQVTRTESGLFHIDSFFDVFTELSVDGGDSWIPSEGPTHIEVTGAQIGEFNVSVMGDRYSWNQIDPGASGGNGWTMPGTSELWFPYPQREDEPEQDEQQPPNVEDWPMWWNEWWYDDPYDSDRIKIISLSFDYSKTNPQENGYAIVTVNWSTTDWSLNAPTGINPSQQPPLFDFDPMNPSVTWVGRMPAFRLDLNDSNPSGQFSLKDHKLPIPYNPEWVSIDVRGYNFSINNGRIIHECVKDPDLPSSVIFEQLDWEGLNTTTPNSNWGRITLDYTRPAGIYYFNLSIDDGMGTTLWVVKDLSIESPGGVETLMTYFDLGVAVGTDVSSLNYGYSITNAPVSGPPAIGAMATVNDLDFQIGGEGGENLGSPGSPNSGLKSDVSPTVVNDPNSGVIPDKDEFVNQPQSDNQCAQGAISNSLKYLQARGGVSSKLPTSISDVGSVIGSDETGTPKTWYLKKKTHYKDHVNTRWIDAPLTIEKVQELVKELKDGQDIEMDLKGHVAVLAGIRLKADGTVDLDLYDDNQKDNKSDPMHTSPLMTNGTDQYVDNLVLERFVIECPKKKTVVGISDFSINTLEEWYATLNGEYAHGSIIPMDPIQWEQYMDLWSNPDLVEDPELPYPETTFLPPQLYVYEGDGDPANPEWPDDGGLVMAWGSEDPPLQSGEYASAWKYKYEPDPDLSNSIVTVSVTAPQFGAGGQVNQVSLGLETPPAGSGNIRSWYWNCGAVGSGAPIEWGVPITITIDTSIAATTAATPTATNFLNAPGFSIINVQWIIVDENATWIGGSTPAPGPGGAPVFMWNYWHWLMVSPKTTLTKALLTKHSQGPVIIDEEVNANPDVPLFWGWDELSDYHIGPIAADDWECKDKRPVTDFHWWGSFPGWREPYPPCQPKAFHIGIWTDTPANPDDPENYSHPDELVWEHVCENYVWNFSGYDRDPRTFGPLNPDDPAGGGIPADDPSLEPDDACFQYNQLLNQDEWFYQEPMEDGTPRTYWLSIAPIWGEECDYKWGWKTRPKYYMDNAVSINGVVTTTTNADGITTTSTAWPPVLGSQWNAGIPLQIPAYDPLNPNHGDAISWDLAFEISTNEKAYEDDPIPGDIGGPGFVLIPDRKVDIYDLAILASNWLMTTP